MVTAWGITTGFGSEGNPLVLAIVPQSEPVLQIIFMVSTMVAAYWFVFYLRNFVESPFPQYKPYYIGIVVWGSLIASGTHIFGISTWVQQYLFCII